MEDQEQETGSRPSPGPESDRRSEPVRSRWTPKPEQILILESIFNSGMVNPPKDETVRIRKLLEKFGSVGDANVFYWFQNRRSRSRRRQRQIQAASVSSSAAGEQPQSQPRDGGGAIQYGDMTSSCPGGFATNYPINTSSSCKLQVGSGPSSSFGLGGNDATPDEFFSYLGRPAAGSQELGQNPFFGPPTDPSSLHYQSGAITVFINGVATEVGRGPLDMKAMFGGDFVLFHSSGVPVQVNEYGFLVQSLQHGESYFLVPRHS